MCNEKIVNDDDQLKLENPIKYYLKHSGNQEIMQELKWIDPELYLIILRLIFLDKIRSHEPTWKCPECGDEIIIDNDKCEEYCPQCGLVTRSNYPYTAGMKYELAYGIRL